MLLQRVWHPNDKTDKRFVAVLRQTEYGYTPIQMQEIRIGEPCILQLTNGSIIQTSPVQSWTVYGHTEIVTKSRRYYCV